MKLIQSKLKHCKKFQAKVSFEDIWAVGLFTSDGNLCNQFQRDKRSSHCGCKWRHFSERISRAIDWLENVQKMGWDNGSAKFSFQKWTFSCVFCQLILLIGWNHIFPQYFRNLDSVYLFRGMSVDFNFSSRGDSFVQMGNTLATYKWALSVTMIQAFHVNILPRRTTYVIKSILWSCEEVC